MARGINVVQVASAPLSVERSGADYPAYIGMAPIWQVDDSNWANLAGKAFLINSMDEMRELVGYYEPENGAWKKEFSLCCAASYHCDVLRVAPLIIVVNAASIVLAEEQGKVEATVEAGKSVKINNPYVVLSSVAVKDKTKGEDFTVAYDGTGRSVVVTALKKLEEAEITYHTVTVEDLTFEMDTFEELDYLEQDIKCIPSTLAVPIWDTQTVTATGKFLGVTLQNICESQLNSHWYTQGVAQLPGETMAEARNHKKSYTSAKVRTCWPAMEYNELIYPAAVVYSAIKQRVDAINDGVPYESPSNEIFTMDRICTMTGGTVRLKEEDANALNEVGICTFNFSDMSWVTWGVCMSNYDEDKLGEIAPDELNDVAVQMRDYISNLFQRKYVKQIDKPMPLRDARDIVTNFQTTVLDLLVTEGRLVYGSIEFLESENSTASLADGEFVYTIKETNTPPGKAITGKISYNAEALTDYYSEEES